MSTVATTAVRPKIPSRYRDPFRPEPWAKPVANVAPRLVRDERVLAKFAEAHMESDPLADRLVEWIESDRSANARSQFDLALVSGVGSVAEAPKALRDFFLEIDAAPPWLDRRQIELASRLFHRTYLGGERVLFSCGLLAGYVSSAVAKVLCATGALTYSASRRAAETQKFVCDVYGPGRMARFSEGFMTTVRVRVMHATVRRRLLARGFDVSRWGVPINQADMAATALQFSITYALGLRGLGFHVSSEELDAVLHLWRYVGLLMGVRPDLLPTNEREAREQLRISVASQEGPDDDSRALAKALLSIDLVQGEGRVPQLLNNADMSFRAALARLAIGKDAADGLAIPDELLAKAAVVVTIPTVFGAECVRRCVPFGSTLAVHLGRRLAARGVHRRLRGHVPSFKP